MDVYVNSVAGVLNAVIANGGEEGAGGHHLGSNAARYTKPLETV